MASIAPRPKIVEIKSQVGPLIDRDLMVGMQMPLAAVVPVPKLGEHYIGGRIAQFEPAAVSYDVRFPTTIYTPPLIPLEAEDTQPAVVSTVSAVAA